MDHGRYLITVWVTENRRLQRDGRPIWAPAASVDSLTTQLSVLSARLVATEVFFESSVPGYPHGYRVTAVVHGLQFPVLSIQFPTQFSVSDEPQFMPAAVL